MTTETLKKANELENEIEKLLKHFSGIKEAMVRISKGGQGESGIIFSGYNGNHYSLRLRLLPMDYLDFMNMYIMKLESEIKRLQKELDSL